MSDLLRTDVIRETLDARIAKYLDTNAAAEQVSKRLPTSSSSMVPIETFVTCRTDTAMYEKNYCVVYGPKKSMDTEKTFYDDSKLLTNRSDSGSEELPSNKSSRLRSKRQCSRGTKT